jgi:hypothetical protein
MSLKQNNLIGLVLVVVGGLALLGNFGLLGGLPTIFFSVAMGGAGIYFIRYHLANRKHFWASIVGFTLIGLAFAAIGGDLAGFYFLGLLGAGFIMTYLQNHKQWWAVIPGGVLLTLASIVAVEEIFPRWDEGTLFFAGLAATFGYLFAYAGQRWAIYPAAALLAVGVLSLSFTGGWVFPALLIAAGFYALNRRKKEVSSGKPTPIVTATPAGPLVVAEPTIEKASTSPLVQSSGDATKSVDKQNVYAETLEKRETPVDEDSSESDEANKNNA